MFCIGDKIVYPVHGAGVIQAIESREILGEERKYYVVHIPAGDMQVMVPVDSADGIGIREVIDASYVENVFAVFGECGNDVALNWNKRYRANMDKIKSGDICEVAEVVRNLMLRNLAKGLSAGEKKMLDSAKQILVSEIMLAKNLEQEQVTTIIDGFFLAADKAEK